MPPLLPEHAIVPPVETFTLTIIATDSYEFLGLNAVLRNGNMATNVSKTEYISEINDITKNYNSAGFLSILDLSVFKHFWRVRKFAKIATISLATSVV